MPIQPLLFLSHSGIDTDDARELKRRIESSPSARREGLRVWFDKDDLKAGTGWQRQLEDVIKDRCTAFAVYVGSKGVMNWVESEVSLGLSRATTDHSVPFIPILAEKTTPSALPPFAALYQGIRDPLNDPAELDKLLEAVLGSRAPVAILDEPFVGLRAMTESDAERFFGRTAELGELVAKLKSSRLVAVVADSGSGKSSLVQAGLIPKFRGGVFADPAQQEPEGRIWHVLTMRPGSAPFDNLRKAVTTASERLALSPKEKAELGELIDPSKPQQTAYALQCNLPAETTETLLVVDQFEELFTQTPEHFRAPFVDWLLSLIAPGAVLGFRVVLTIRSDYFNLCSTHPALFDLLKQDKAYFRLKQLTAEGLAAIVHQPLLMAGQKDRDEQDALIAQIRRDVSDRPGDLALVQMALFETWKQHKQDQSSLLEAYAKVGGVSGALAHAAEEVRTDKLDGKQQDLLEPVLVRLINLGDTGGATRRVARIDEFDDSPRDLIQMLSEERCSRLLLLGAETVDICHEQLITQWPWLQSRITKDAASVRLLGRLIERVREWSQAEDKTKDEYLATGAELESFDNLEKQQKGWLSPIETKYVAASKTAQERTLKRTARLQRIVAWAFAAVGAVILIAGATIAYLQADKAKQLAEREFELTEKQGQLGEQRIELNHERANLLAELSETKLLRGEIDSALRLASDGVLIDLVLPPRAAMASSAPAALAAAASQAHWHLVLVHQAKVTSAAFNPDGSRIVTASDDKTARIWDAATGQEVAVLRGHEGIVGSAAFSPDGSRIVTASGDKTARIWDAATGKEVTVLRGHDSLVTSAAFSPDGLLIVTASADKSARIWNAETGKEVVALRHNGVVESAAFSRHGSRIVTASVDNSAQIWDVTTGKEVAVLRGHDGPVTSAAFSPDGSRIVTASWDKSARIWDAATGKEVAVLRGHDGFVRSAAFSGDGSRVVTASDDETARIWDAATSKEVAVLRGHEDSVKSAAFSPDGSRIVTASDDKTVRIWDAAAGKEVAVLRGHEDGVESAAFSGDGSRIVTASDDKTARIWDAATGKEVRVLRGHEADVSSAAFSPDGSRIVTASDDETARIWDAATGKEVRVLRGHNDRLESAAFSPDGSRIVTASDDETARIWDAATGKELAVLRGHTGGVETAVFSPDGSRIVTASDDKTVLIWDAATGAEVGVLRGHDGLVTSAAFSPDGLRIVTASADKSARIWNAETGKEVAALRHDGPVESAAFSRDGSHIVTTSSDRTARIWDAATGKEVAVLRHDSPVGSATFNPDGSRIVTASADKTARIWDVSLEMMTAKVMLAEAACANFLHGISKLTPEEMRLAGYPDSTEEIDVCSERVR
jgi:WD40 repeat protein